MKKIKGVVLVRYNILVIHLICGSAWITPIIAQNSFAEADKLFKEVIEIRKDTGYIKIWSKQQLQQGINKIDNLRDNLLKLRSLDTSIEWQNTVNSHINKLDLRREAYRAKLEGRTITENTARRDSCLSMLNRYIQDESRRMFISGADRKRQIIERFFLTEFAECLNVIAQDSEGYQEAAQILNNIILPPSEIIKLWIENPDLRKLFAENWHLLSDSTTFMIAQSFTDWLKDDSLSAKKFWRAAYSTGDVRAASQILLALLLQLEKSPESIGVWYEFVQQFPVDKVDKETLNVFSRVARRMDDRRLVISVLDSLISSRPEPEYNQKINALKLYERLTAEQLRRNNIVQFCQKAKAIHDYRTKGNPPVLIMGNILHAGAVSAELPGEYKQEISKQFTNTFQKAYEITDSPHEFEKGITNEFYNAKNRLKPIKFSQPPEIIVSISDRPVFILAGAYIFTENTKQLELFFRLADAQDGIVLLAKSTKLTIKNGSFDDYRKNLENFAERVFEAFEDEINNALTLEDIINTPLVWNSEKIKAALFYGFSFGIERTRLWDSIPLHAINHIQISEPFWEDNPSNKVLLNFTEKLKDQLSRIYSTDVLILDSKEIAPVDAVLLTGKVKMRNPLQFEIAMTVARNFDSWDAPDTLAKIDLGFLQPADKIEAFQTERAIDVVESNLQVLIRVKPISNIPIKSLLPPISQVRISPLEGVPSLLFAGTSQISIASRINSNNPFWLRATGIVFASAEIALLVNALRYDNKAIENTDNKALNKRNNFLLAAGGVALLSAGHALWKIVRHNKRIK